MPNKRVFKGFRLHIGLFGRRNVGKSSLLNAITRQDVSIVSKQAGTTTDPVEKPMELLPLGPVLFIDTAGIDDQGALGDLRIKKTKRAIQRTDIAVIITENNVWGEFEEQLANEFHKLAVPFMVVINKTDSHVVSAQFSDLLQNKGIKHVETSALKSKGISELRKTLLSLAPDDFINNPAIIGDLLNPGEMAVLVVPIDKEAPKGRLILPQVQSIRDLLDHDSMCLVVKERELQHALNQLKNKPKLVVTDSQAFLKVAADTPLDILLTSFSILYSRFKGDLLTQVEGAMAVDELKSGDRVLIAEACSHHPIGEDIGRVKIPRWLTQYVGGKLHFDTVQGRDFPEDVSAYKLVIHCGACMFNRRAMLSRLMLCRQAQVPISNYGLVIAYSLGIFERALGPFPAAKERYLQLRQERSDIW